MKTRHVLNGCLCLAILLSPSGHAQAQTDPNNVGPADVTALTVGTSLFAIGAVIHFAAPMTQTGWNTGILFDAPVRETLRLDSYNDRNQAAIVSDVLMALQAGYTLGGEGLLTGILRNEYTLSFRTSAANVLAMGITLSFGEAIKSIIGRQRPNGLDCTELSTERNCVGSDRYRSFYSLHSALAFTMAGLSCSHHLEANLFQERTHGYIACGSGLAAALSIGALRVLSDSHHLTDVLVGGTIGFLTGYLVPLLLRPLPDRTGLDGSGHALVLPTFEPYGLSFAGTL